MRCPYCDSEISQAAIVCPHCTRDFFLFKPLLERIEKLEKQIAGQSDSAVYEVRIAALEQDLAAARSGKPGGGIGVMVNGRLIVPADEDDAAGSLKNYWASLLLALVPTAGLLLAAHYLLLFVFDVTPLYLRIVTLLIPIPFGFAMYVWHPHRIKASAVAGFFLAVAAVWLMLMTTARIDHVAVLPETARDLREVFEYIVSIGLAFLTGLLLGKWRYRNLHISPQPNRLIIFVAELFTTDEQGELGVVRHANRIQKIVTALTPMVTGVASVYAGIRALIGN